jgi:hypothetical protein
MMEIRTGQLKVDAHQNNLHICCPNVRAGDNPRRISCINENVSISIYLNVRNAVGVECQIARSR